MMNIIESIKKFFAYTPQKTKRKRKYPAIRYKIDNPLYKTDKDKLTRKIKRARFTDIVDDINDLSLGLFEFLDYDELDKIFNTPIINIKSAADRNLDSISQILSFVKKSKLRKIKSICDKLNKRENNYLRKRLYSKQGAEELAVNTIMYADKNFEKFNSLKESIDDGSNLVWIFIARDDYKTCKICSKLNESYFEYDDNDILKYLPPFHIGCTCTFSVFQKSALKEIFSNAKPADKNNLDIDYYKVLPRWNK